MLMVPKIDSAMATATACPPQGASVADHQIIRTVAKLRAQRLAFCRFVDRFIDPDWHMPESFSRYSPALQFMASASSPFKWDFDFTFRVLKSYTPIFQKSTT